MDLQNRFKQFSDLITRGQTLQAIQRFYHEDVVLVENNESPLIGLENALELEKKNIERVKSFQIEIPLFVVDERQAVVLGEMDIHVVYKNDVEVKFREAFVQKWANGKLTYQRFYYSLPKS